MEGLGTLLLFAALFYTLMRVTCGKELVHGKRVTDTPVNDKRDIDPVCGRAVETRAEFTLMHYGKVYRFCSLKCHDEFEANPEKYVNLSVKI